MSAPIIPIVNTCQSAAAWAPIVWDAACFQTVPNRWIIDHSQAPPPVTWSLLSRLLSVNFQRMVGSLLSPEHLNLLGSKLLQHYPVQGTKLVTWSQFFKTSLPNREHTFWDWYYGSSDLISKHAATIWNKGSIAGFISRQQAESILVTTSPGTFLLRFSDSIVGLAIAVKGESGVGMIAPFSETELKICSLANRIMDLPELTILHPSLPKAEAFKEFCETRNRMQSVAIPNYIPRLIAVYFEW